MLEIPSEFSDRDFLPWFMTNYEEEDPAPAPIDALNPAPSPRDIAAFREHIHTYLKIYGELEVEDDNEHLEYRDLSARVSLTSLWRLVLTRAEAVLLPGAPEQDMSGYAYTRIEVWPAEANPVHYDEARVRIDMDPSRVKDDYDNRTLSASEFLALTLDVEAALATQEAALAAQKPNAPGN